MGVSGVFPRRCARQPPLEHPPHTARDWKCDSYDSMASRTGRTSRVRFLSAASGAGWGTLSVRDQLPSSTHARKPLPRAQTVERGRTGTEARWVTFGACGVETQTRVFGV
jgi:hypothetical protein